MDATARAEPRGWGRNAATFAAAAAALSVPALPFGRAVTMGLLAATLLALALSPERARYLADLKGRLRHPVAIALLAVALLWLPAVVGSIAPGKSLLVWGRSLFYVAGAVLLWSFLSRDRRARELALRLLLAGSALAAAFSLYSLFVQAEPIAFLRGDGWRVVNVSYLIKYFASAVLCLAPVSLWAGFRLSGAWRLVGIGIAAAAVALILGLNSGAAILGLVLTAAAIATLALLRRRALLPLLALGAVLAASAYFGARFMQETRGYEGYDLGRLELFAPDWLLDPHRQVIWSFTLGKGLESPWTGHGIDTINRVAGANDPIPGLGLEYIPSHPHNWLLEVFAETGLVGTVPLLVALGLLAAGFVRDYWRTGGTAPLAALALFVAFWGSSLMNFSVWASWWQATFLVLTALPLADRGSTQGEELAGSH